RHTDRNHTCQNPTLDGTRPGRRVVPTAAESLRAPHHPSWAFVFALSAVLAYLLNNAVSDAVPHVVEPSPGSGAIVATRPLRVCPVYGSEAPLDDDGCEAVPQDGPDQDPPQIAIIAFIDRAGTIRSLSCPTASNREDSTYFPDVIQAMEAYLRLCAAAQA